MLINVLTISLSLFCSSFFIFLKIVLPHSLNISPRFGNNNSNAINDLKILMCCQINFLACHVRGAYVFCFIIFRKNWQLFVKILFLRNFGNKRKRMI